MGKLKVILSILIISLLLTSNCYAEEFTTDEFFDDSYKQFEYSNLSKKLSINNVLNYITDILKSEVKNCSSIFTSLILIIIIFSVLNGFSFPDKTYLQFAFTTIAGSVIFSIALNTIKSNVELVKTSIENAKIFSISAVPVVTTLSVTSGNSFGNTIFSACISICSGLFQIISNDVIIPFILIYTLLGMSSIFTNDYNVISLCNMLKKAFKWITTSFLSIFTFIMSIQSVLSKSADNITKKSIKNAVGKFIPIVGSALSVSVDTIFSLAEATRASAGIFGACIIISLLLPVIIGNLCYAITFLICKYISSFLQLKRLEKVIEIISNIFFMLSALSGCCAFMLIISFLSICINVV